MIDALADLGLPGAGRLDGYPGVWVGMGRTPQDLRHRVRSHRGPLDARLRPQRRPRHGLVRGASSLRDRPAPAVTSLAAEGIDVHRWPTWSSRGGPARAEVVGRADGVRGGASVDASDRVPGRREPQRERRAQAGVAAGPRPSWAPTTAPSSAMRTLDLVTVCEEAGCPNIYECWSEGTATFMLNGERCTRACGFCQVDTSRPWRPTRPSPNGSRRPSRRWGWTTRWSPPWRSRRPPRRRRRRVRRDGEGHASAHAARPVEVLIPDCKGDPRSLAAIFDARPDVVNHNLETVRVCNGWCVRRPPTPAACPCWPGPRRRA